MSPPIFTPNGDGINDAARIEFSVFRLDGAARFSVRIHDLAGRVVRDLSFDRMNASGDHALEWDGRDLSGKLVAPGAYVLRVEFSADVDGELGFLAPVRVAY